MIKIELYHNFNLLVNTDGIILYKLFNKLIKYYKWLIL